MFRDRLRNFYLKCRGLFLKNYSSRESAKFESNIESDGFDYIGCSIEVDHDAEVERLMDEYDVDEYIAERAQEYIDDAGLDEDDAISIALEE